MIIRCSHLLFLLMSGANDTPHSIDSACILVTDEYSNILYDKKILHLIKRDEGPLLRGTTLLHRFLSKQCTHDSITGTPASGYCLSPKELQGEFGDYACCLAPADSSLENIMNSYYSFSSFLHILCYYMKKHQARQEVRAILSQQFLYLFLCRNLPGNHQFSVDHH